MAIREIVIQLPENIYKEILKTEVWDEYEKRVVRFAIRNGTILPKRHGKLVDVKSIPEEDRNITVKSLLHPGTIAYAGSISLEEYINELTTIIEADKEESDESSIVPLDF